MNTVNLSYNVTGQKIMPNEPCPYLLASETVNYVKVAFSLDSDWQIYDVVRAVWSGINQQIATVLDSEGVCFVPHELLSKRQKVYVNLYGCDLDNETVLERITTYPLFAINVNATAYVNGSETAPITPSQFEQFINQVIDLVGSVTDIDRIELTDDYMLVVYYSNGTQSEPLGPIRGPQGEQGIQGETGPQGETGNGIDRIELTDTTGAVKTYTIYFTDGSTYDFEVTDGEVTDAVLDEATIVQTNSDNVPYLFRNSGGDVRTGRKEFDTIVGGTVAWNQLVHNGNFADGTTYWNGSSCTLSASNKKLLMEGTGEQPYARQALNFVANHKYMFLAKMSADANNANSYAPHIALNWGSWGYKAFSAITKGTSADLSCILSPNADGTALAIYGATNATAGDKFTLENVIGIDLTQMFGSTIADYIYSLEQANAGAGVAWFKKLFPKPYYPYNAGELMSVNASSHDMVGFNACEEAITNAVSTQYATCLYAKCKLLPNTDYCISFDGANGNLLYANENLFVYKTITVGSTRTQAIIHTKDVISEDNNLQYDTTRNAWVILKNNAGNAVTPSFTDVCINLSWDGERDGEYEAYVKHSYALDSSLTLRGIPKLDNGNLYYDGDTYESDGTVTRKYGVVDLGTLDYGTPTSSGRTSATLGSKSPTGGDYIANMICVPYQVISTQNWYNATSNGIAVCGSGYGTDGNLGIVDSAFIGKTSAEVKSLLSGKYLVYEKATPTTETADPYTNPQIVDPSGTEEYVGSPIPVGHETDYPMTLTDTMPTADGTYTMSVTVVNGKRTVNWT